MSRCARSMLRFLSLRGAASLLSPLPPWQALPNLKSRPSSRPLPAFGGGGSGCWARTNSPRRTTPSRHYDILAKAPGEEPPTLDEQMTMLRKLPADRWQLTFHRVQKELPVYALTVAKGGPKLRESTASAAAAPEGPPPLIFVVMPQLVHLPGHMRPWRNWPRFCSGRRSTTRYWTGRGFPPGTISTWSSHRTKPYSAEPWERALTIPPSPASLPQSSSNSASDWKRPKGRSTCW